MTRGTILALAVCGALGCGGSDPGTLVIVQVVQPEGGAPAASVMQGEQAPADAGAYMAPEQDADTETSSRGTDSSTTTSDPPPADAGMQVVAEASTGTPAGPPPPSAAPNNLCADHDPGSGVDAVGGAPVAGVCSYHGYQYPMCALDAGVASGFPCAVVLGGACFFDWECP